MTGGRTITWALLLCAGVANLAGAQAPPETPQAGPSPYAWSTSIALEQAGDLTQARSVMVASYGPRPTFYDPCVRLAWLNLLLRDAGEAIALYRRARQLEGALPEAGTGLASALTLAGYQALDRGDLSTARRSWEEALALNSSAGDARHGLGLVGASSGITPEVWAAQIAASDSSSTAKVLYIQVPVRLSGSLAVRGAYRRVGSATAGLGTASFFGSQNEVFFGVGLERGITATDAVAFQLSNVLGTSRGAAIGWRLGGRRGALFTVSAIHRSDGWNVQVAPLAFAWLTPSFSIAAGVRMTHDPLVSAASALADVTFRLGQVTLDLRGHAGTERWAFDLAGPTILSFLANASRGTTFTTSAQLSSNLALFAQGQYESTASSAATGWYGSAAVGMRLTPSNAKPTQSRR